MNMHTFLRKPVVKNILWIIIVTVCGFILWNITFLIDALFQTIIRRFIMLFTSSDGPNGWIFMTHALFMIVICLISWPILKSRLGTIYKATFTTVPLALVLVTIGIYFSQWPMIVYALGGLFVAGILYYLYRNKQSWIYYYAVIFVGLTLTIFTLMGGEI